MLHACILYMLSIHHDSPETSSVHSCRVTGIGHSGDVGGCCEQPSQALLQAREGAGQYNRAAVWGVWTGLLYGPCVPVWLQILTIPEGPTLCMGLPRLVWRVAFFVLVNISLPWFHGLYSSAFEANILGPISVKLVNPG